MYRQDVPKTYAKHLLWRGRYHLPLRPQTERLPPGHEHQLIPCATKPLPAFKSELSAALCVNPCAKRLFPRNNLGLTYFSLKLSIPIKSSTNGVQKLRFCPNGSHWARYVHLHTTVQIDRAVTLNVDKLITVRFKKMFCTVIFW